MTLRLAFVVAMMWGLGAGPGQAATVDLSNWTNQPPPSYDTSALGWKILDPGAAKIGNGGARTFLSDFAVTGNFRFTGTVATVRLVDNDPLGIVFGWQDESNHYRFGMNGFDSRKSGHGYPDRGSSDEDGLWLIRETNGVDNVLFNDVPFAYDNRASYDFSVKRVGQTIAYKLREGGGGAMLFSGEIDDTVYTTGHLGIYAESMNGLFSNLSLRARARNLVFPAPESLALRASVAEARLAAVPVAPSALFLFSAALVGFLSSCARGRSA
jgi:hypothetical protein